MADSWVVIDFETASGRGTPCQVAALRMQDGIALDAFSTYVFQPADSFDGFNVSLHGITPDMVSAAPPWPCVAEGLLEFANGAPFVAHYAPFDVGVIRDACDICELARAAVHAEQSHGSAKTSYSSLIRLYSHLL
ncbi:MAG TPA: exonuclease domain-containing protein [Gaiellaceae bacterium]|nr:exonuclease domain-containing protein [Gaiellaceae bacterium]